jgi:hypothetical protein
MRFDGQDRRMADRRLKNRIPEALKMGLRGAPKVAIIIAATVFVTPEALAKIEGGKAEPLFVMKTDNNAQAKVVEKTYSKAELGKKMPANPIAGMKERIISEMNSLINSVIKNNTSGRSRGKIEKFKPNSYSAYEYNLHIAALKTPPATNSTDSDGLSSHLTQDMKSAVRNRVRSEFSFLDSFSSGLDFNVDFASIFSGGGSAEPKSQPRGNVKYGLVLKDIKTGKSPNHAALGSMEDQLEFAGHADVQWTIGPVQEASGRRMFNISEKIQKPQGPSKAEKKSLWDYVSLPKPSFRGKAAPEGVDGAAESSTVSGNANLPSWRLELAQEEGLYHLVYRTKSTGEKINGEHTFRVPIYGQFALGRRFDDNWHVYQTSAYNILVDKQAPVVSVHYMNMEQRYKADMGYDFSGHKIGVSGKGKATGKVAKEADRPESYSINYGKQF